MPKRSIRKIMRRMAKSVLFLACMAVLTVMLGACHILDDWLEEEEIIMKFKDPNLTVMRGGLARFDLIMEPESAYLDRGVDYEVSANSVARIYSGDRKGVIVTGVGVGSAIITAKSGASKAEAVLVVTESLAGGPGY